MSATTAQSFDAFLAYDERDEGQALKVAARMQKHGFTVRLEPARAHPERPPRWLPEPAPTRNCAACILLIGASGAPPWSSDRARDLLQARAKAARNGGFRFIFLILNPNAFELVEPTFPPELRAERVLNVLEDESELRALIGYVCGTDRLTRAEAEADRNGVLYQWRAAMRAYASSALPHPRNRGGDRAASAAAEGSAAHAPLASGAAAKQRTSPASAPPPRGRARQARTPVAERYLAALVLFLSLPLLVLIAFAIRVTSGSPVFHRGTRLGRGKRPFQMIKFRTLRIGAHHVIGGELLGHLGHLTTPGGRFLRDTGLDELPQLWNVVRGEMRFVGPRPERPEVYAARCAGIPGYERRFEVPPGIVGVSQLFTPHGTSKRYRTLIDNSTLRTGPCGAGLVLRATLALVVRSWVQLRTSSLLARLSGRRYLEKRRMRRMKPIGAIAHHVSSARAHRLYRVVDMNEDALVVECDDALEPDPGDELVLEIRLNRGRDRPAKRHASCQVSVIQRRQCPSGVRMVLRYWPKTPRSEYMVHQYFLRTSLAPHHTIWQAPAADPRPVSEAPADSNVERPRRTIELPTVLERP